MIPAIRRYEIDCWGNAIQQVEGGEWVRYNYHVASVVVMQSEIERLTEENADLKSKLERESTEELTRKIAELAVLLLGQDDVKKR